MKEWSTIPSAPDYEVSDRGLVRRKTVHKLASRWPISRELVCRLNYAGYRKVMLVLSDGTRRGFRVARLVAEAFLGPAVGREVNHRDGNKQNDSVKNIEYVTRKENVRHAFATGLLVRAEGGSAPVAKLTDAQADEIRRAYRRYERNASQTVLARRYGVSGHTISDIVRGVTYAAHDRADNRHGAGPCY